MEPIFVLVLVLDLRTPRSIEDEDDKELRVNTRPDREEVAASRTSIFMIIIFSILFGVGRLVTRKDVGLMQRISA